MMTDQETIVVYDSQVENYADLVNKNHIDEQLIGVIKRCKPNDYILDLGCGPAVSSATMRDHKLRVDPVDASTEMVKLANQAFKINARQAFFQDIDGINIYDGIWANFSLLHASSEELPGILALLHRSLKPGGSLHMGMKTGSGFRRDKLGRYYSYYSEHELRNLLKAAGFSVDNVETGEARGLAGDLEPWIAVTSIGS